MTFSRNHLLLLALLVGISCCSALAEPSVGIGLYFKADDVLAMRAKIGKAPCQPIYQQIKKEADDGLAKWAEEKRTLHIEELAPELPELDINFPREVIVPEDARAASKALERYVDFPAPAAAFVYLMTGERKYADFAWNVFQQAAKVKRWGWFPWSGTHVPHIHFGTICRNMMLIADCVWDTLPPEQRHMARQVIADKCVEPYYRMVLHTPGMGLYHLRSRNQGSNVLAAALIGSLFVGDEVADNRIWFNSLLQTYHWAITSDIGWMGGHLESGLPGYWSVSMQNLYTAAVALNNVRGIDLRVHPGFDQATYYAIIHEATVPPVGQFKDPIPQKPQGVTGIISPKPTELPHEPRDAAWVYDYAYRFPDSPAHYFASKVMIRPERLVIEDAHQAALGQVLVIAWWHDELLAPAKAPTSLAQFTDRMAGIRSGYGFNQTYLYFNGDIFLSAKNDILCTTAGLAWHFPWHQYAITESCIETEGEPFAPSMVIDRAYDDANFAYFHSRSGTSNVTYYMLPGQRDSYTHYEKRDRGILFVRGNRTMPDYFLFLDQVKEKEPRWHAFNWHLWNRCDDERNYGKFAVESQNAVRGMRPNADVWIQFLSPTQLTFEQHGIPSMPFVQYQMNHNAQLLRCVAGATKLVGANKVRIDASAWKDLGEAKDNTLYVEKPPTERRVFSQIVTGLTGGLRYRWATQSKKSDYRAYEATAWAIDLELLDKAGNVVAKPQTPYGHPDPLRIGDPMSDTLTHDWTETAQYFDAPANAVACRASFFAVGWAHYFHLGKLWLRPIELMPVGVPERSTEQMFLTLVMPLDKSAQPPAIVNHGNHWTIGQSDEVTLQADGTLRIARQDKETGTSVQFSTDTLHGMPNTLKTNSDDNARLLLAGLKPVLDDIAAERDELTRTGRTNLALDAKVTASATRDARFAPEHVIDNQAAEYPLDGHLDYTLGEVESSGRTIGYGMGKESLTAGRDSWPLYVKPTYWLLPEQTAGWIELQLKQPATIDTVRLLNTSNAGLNDYAASAVRVELYDAAHTLLASKDATFGKVFDAPFRQAFVMPKFFDHYTPTFAGMLEPGIAVPFGDGWKSVAFADVKNVAFVRVVITRYWALGGGLNEVQVYGH